MTKELLSNAVGPQESSKDSASRPWKIALMANLSTAYNEEYDKYSGSETDNFERKHMIFLEHCKQADILDKDRRRAFSVMLTRHAHQCYFDFMKPEFLPVHDLSQQLMLGS